MSRKPPKQELPDVSEWREEKLFVRETLTELKADVKEILKRQNEQDKEISHLKWKSGVISAIAGVISSRFTGLFHD